MVDTKPGIYFDPFLLEWVEASAFSEYKSAIELLVQDITSIADAGSSFIKCERFADTVSYYLESQPSLQEETYSSDGRKSDYKYTSLLLSGMNVILTGVLTSNLNRGNNTGLLYGLRATDEQVLVLQPSSIGENLTMRYLRAGRTNLNKWESWREVAIAVDDISTLEVCAKKESNKRVKSKTKKGQDIAAARSTVSIYPIANVVGKTYVDEYNESLMRRRTIHNAIGGHEFYGSWFTPYTHNGGWDVNRCAPLCECLGNIVANWAALKTDHLWVGLTQIPALDIDLAIKESLSLSKTFLSLFVSPLTFLAGNAAVFTSSQVVEAKCWVNLIKQFDEVSSFDRYLPLLAKPSESVVDEYGDVAATMPIVISTGIFAEERVPSSISCGHTLMVAPEFMLIDITDGMSLAKLTVDDLCKLIFDNSSIESISLTCGVDHATYTYRVYASDTLVTSNTYTLVSSAMSKMFDKVSAYLTRSNVKKIRKSYAAFFAHVLMNRQCRGYWYGLSHSQLLVSRNRILDIANQGGMVKNEQQQPDERSRKGWKEWWKEIF